MNTRTRPDLRRTDGCLATWQGGKSRVWHYCDLRPDHHGDHECGCGHRHPRRPRTPKEA